MRLVRFGILGLGGIANRFASVLVKTQGVSLVSVAAMDLGRSREFADKYGSVNAYDSYDQLIAEEGVDVIYVATTHNLHLELVKKCLNGGKAVICEKPLATNARDASELIELSQKKGVLLVEAMWTRCLPAFQKARSWVAAGTIGKVSLIEASFAFNIPFLPDHRLYRPELAGGSLFDAGVYPVEFAIGILDEASVKSVGLASLAPTGVDEFFSFSLAFPGGALASLSCGFKAKTSWDAAVNGTDGKIVVYEFLSTQRCERFNEKGESVEVFEVKHDDGFTYEIQHCAELFRNGKTQSPLIPHRDTLACAKVFDELMASLGSK